MIKAAKKKVEHTANDDLNITGKNIEGRWIVLKQSFFGKEYTGNRVARAVGGFGCDPTDSRRAVHVAGQGRIDRLCVERFATEEEIAAATATEA